MSLDPITVGELRAIEKAGYMGRDVEGARTLMRGAVQSASDVATLVGMFASSSSHDIVTALIRTIRDKPANSTVADSFGFLLAVAGEYRRDWHSGVVEMLLGFIVEFWVLETAETYPLEKLKPLIDTFIEATGLNPSALNLIEEVLLGAAIQAPGALPRFVSEMARTVIIDRIRNPPECVWTDLIRELDPSDAEKERIVLQALLALAPNNTNL